MRKTPSTLLPINKVIFISHAPKRDGTGLALTMKITRPTLVSLISEPATPPPVKCWLCKQHSLFLASHTPLKCGLWLLLAWYSRNVPLCCYCSLCYYYGPACHRCSLIM